MGALDLYNFGWKKLDSAGPVVSIGRDPTMPKMCRTIALRHIIHLLHAEFESQTDDRKRLAAEPIFEEKLDGRSRPGCRATCWAGRVICRRASV